MTHYIPAFTRVQARTQQAACGTYIPPREHAIEPTCPVCAAWLAAEDATAEADYEAMGFVRDTDGTWILPRQTHERGTR